MNFNSDDDQLLKLSRIQLNFVIHFLFYIYFSTIIQVIEKLVELIYPRVINNQGR